MYCRIQIYVLYLYRNQKQNKMKAKKYIDLSTKVSKRYEGKNYIDRFMHLLNIIAPNKYMLDTMNMLASIENKETQLTVLIFSDNPF